MVGMGVFSPLLSICSLFSGGGFFAIEATLTLHQQHLRAIMMDYSTLCLLRSPYLFFFLFFAPSHETEHRQEDKKTNVRTSHTSSPDPEKNTRHSSPPPPPPNPFPLHPQERKRNDRIPTQF